jgi:hypothetical protein
MFHPLIYSFVSYVVLLPTYSHFIVSSNDIFPSVYLTPYTGLITPKASDKIKLNTPTPFTGKQNEFVLFMQDIYIYLKVNQHIYNDDNKKISFILSYLTGGDAAIWKQQFIQTKIEEHKRDKTKEPNWETY